MKTLSLCSRFSFEATKSLLDADIFRVIDGFLPSLDEQKRQHFSADQYPFIIDAIHLLDTVLPEREDLLNNEAEKQRRGLEKEKRQLFQH